VGGSEAIADHLRATYSPDGARSFDYHYMSSVFETPFEVLAVDIGSMPDLHEPTITLGRHLSGNRIGFDLGASDYKVSAVIDGEAVYADEFPWLPTTQTDVEYHYGHISAGLRKAAEHLPQVDAIGGSSAGVWIDDRVRAASLFRGLSAEDFESGAKNIVNRLRKDWGVPISIVNDGEVTALAGSMSLEANAVLGIAMGSSEAAGYVNGKGDITTGLNELAFTPIDLQPGAPLDEWSGDAGCGVQYFCQTGAIRLALKAGVLLDGGLTPAQKLKVIQDLMANGDSRLPAVFESIGIWLGYALAFYNEFYDIAHVLVLGRVTSGQGGEIVVAKARQVLADEFPDIDMELHVPDERMKRVGQSVAAASLPEVAK
jgi:predicted NBD/HSP70 family sugar kinase